MTLRSKCLRLLALALLALGSVPLASVAAQTSPEGPQANTVRETASRQSGAAAAPLAPVAADEVIDSALRLALAESRAADDAAMVPVYLVMRDQLEAASLTKATRGMSRAARRATIVQRLKEHATATQAAVRAVLDAAVVEGRAAKVQVLWMGNALVFMARPAVIEALATLPGIDAIRLDVTPDPAQVEDAMPAAPAAPAPPAAMAPPAQPPASDHPGNTPYPFADDFESGALKPWWTVATTGKGYAKVSGDFGPLGNGHLLMATSVDGVDSTASVTLTLDLAGKSHVQVSFQHKSFVDDPDALDGVFLSADGTNYQLAYPLLDGTAEYSKRKFDLDEVSAALGLPYTSAFRIRFQWHDNFDIPTDGFGFDDIVVGPKPPPPPPEPNIVALQAPQLWALGFRGQGVLIGTIDSGVLITHPDLKHRIWNNPGEIPGNGLDDDGDGFVDDVHGWNFINGTSDVTSSDPHGTSTAGIAVGDGDNGEHSTGMAPGALLLVCTTFSEVHYWQAQQYCLERGVDVITSSQSFKWFFQPAPNYHMARQLAEVELAAGIVHANSIGNSGTDFRLSPIPFNISSPGNCPSPFAHPEAVAGGHTSMLACGGIELGSDDLYQYSSVGPAAWEDIKLYSPAYNLPQFPKYWDYPFGGFGGTLPGLIKPDIVAYTDVITTAIDPLYTTFGGTSAATPHLGGALALLRCVQPEAEPRHLAAALELSAHDLGAPGKDNVFGAGKLQVLDAARRLRVLTRVDDQTPALGSTLGLDLFGGPSTPVAGWFSGAIADYSTAFNLVQPIFELGLVPLNGSGTAHVAFTIPVDPMLIGVTAWFQFGSKNWDPAWGPGLLLSVPESITIGS